jgi:hypothetical protein
MLPFDGLADCLVDRCPESNISQRERITSEWLVAQDHCRACERRRDSFGQLEQRQVICGPE